MKTRVMIFTACMLVTAGCAAPGSTTTKGSSIACPTYAITATSCSGNKNDPIVDIDTAALTFNPAIICAKKSKWIKFELNPVPDNKEGSAAIIPKDYKDSWLTGTNVPNKKKIRIKVPNWVTNHTYEYMFVTSTGKCVDPRVEVMN